MTCVCYHKEAFMLGFFAMGMTMILLEYLEAYMKVRREENLKNGAINCIT